MRRFLMVLMLAVTLSGCFSSGIVVVRPMPYIPGRSWSYLHDYQYYPRPRVIVIPRHHHNRVVIQSPRHEQRREFGDTRQQGNRR